MISYQIAAVGRDAASPRSSVQERNERRLNISLTAADTLREPDDSTWGIPVKRIAVLATATVAAVVALAGCVSLEADLELDSQARATGMLEVGVDKNAASMMGLSSLDAFERQMEASRKEGDSGPNIGTGELTYTESDTSYIAHAEMSGAALADPEFMSAKRAGDTVTFSFRNSGSEDAPEMMGDVGSVSMTVKFPGKLQKVTGAEQVDDRTIRISGAMTDPFSVEATSEVGRAFPLLVLALLGGGIAFLAVVGVGLTIYLLRRRRPRQPPLTASDSQFPSGAPTSESQ